MEVSRIFFEGDDSYRIPAFRIDTSSERAFLVIHGYSSSKSAWLGFGFDVAEKGSDVFVIDLRGHGENEMELDEDVMDDVAVAVEMLKENYSEVLALGHSLGGLLALNSTADFVYAVSPPLSPRILPEPRFMLRLKSCTVREKDPEVLFRILEKYNPPERKSNAVVFYGSNESEGFKMAIRKWADGRDVEVVELHEMQASMPYVDVDAERLKAYLPNFISHISVSASSKIVERIRF